ncbi:MAG: tetratricopeptide repeat protein [Planctomycetota bacterium]|nr:tetratricopeptide repeat protein [Planctomycetota bacterium]
MLRILLSLVLLLPLHCGCRSLRLNRHERNLGSARQFSLRGAALLQQEKYAEATPMFQEALNLSEADERAQWGMAEVLWREGNREEAIVHLSRAIQLSGKNPELLVRLGDMHLELGNLTDATEQAEAALRVTRKHEGAWALKGKIYRAQERNDDAMDCYQRALIYNPENFKARIAVADIYRDLGKPQRALATIERLADSHVIESIPARAWMLKGLALADLGEMPDAENCLYEALVCAEDNSDLLIELAEKRIELGHVAEARTVLAQIISHNPNNRQALRLQQAISDSAVRSLPVDMVSGTNRYATENLPLNPPKPFAGP